MKHIGIIAEYNPFHNGHQYQLDTIRQVFPGREIIIIQSGNYVQRGEPAVYNKHLRAGLALSAGASLVLELPLPMATASAEFFARSAVMSLYQTGVVDTICFGAETDQLPVLQKLASLFYEEPEDYRIHLQQFLKDGLSFPKARARAAARYLHDPEAESILNTPNNILGIEYIKAAYEFHLPISFYVIKRFGDAYNNPQAESDFCSATALRSLLREQNIDYSQYVPPHVYQSLRLSEEAHPLYADDFYSFMQYALWDKSLQLADYPDLDRDLINRFRSLTLYPGSYQELLDTLSSRNYTTSRIRRILCHILLHVTTEDIELCRKLQYAPYLRILGCRRDCSFLLKAIRSHNRIPLIQKVSHADRLLSKELLRLFQKELQADSLYRQVFYNRYKQILPDEYRRSIIIYPNPHRLK